MPDVHEPTERHNHLRGRRLLWLWYHLAALFGLYGVALVWREPAWLHSNPPWAHNMMVEWVFLVALLGRWADVLSSLAAIGTVDVAAGSEPVWSPGLRARQLLKGGVRQTALLLVSAVVVLGAMWTLEAARVPPWWLHLAEAIATGFWGVVGLAGFARAASNLTVPVAAHLTWLWLVPSVVRQHMKEAAWLAGWGREEPHLNAGEAQRLRCATPDRQTLRHGLRLAVIVGRLLGVFLATVGLYLWVTHSLDRAAVHNGLAGALGIWGAAGWVDTQACQRKVEMFLFLPDRNVPL